MTLPPVMAVTPDGLTGVGAGVTPWLMTLPIHRALRSDPDGLTDDDVVAGARAGHRALFEVLMRRNNQRLYRAIRAVLRDDVEVEDVMQQTYLSAFAHLDQFAGAAKFSTWLLRIGVHEALARLRQRRPLESLEQRGDDREPAPVEIQTPTPEDRSAGRELASFLEELIDQLPVHYRQVLVLRLVQELDTAETAAILGLGEETVRQRLHRARAMVGRAIEQRVGSFAAAVFAFEAPRCDRVVAAVMARLPRR